MKRFALSLLLFTGCAGPVPVHLSTTDAEDLINPNADPSPEIVELLDDAFGFWGLTYSLVPPDTIWGSYGAIDLIVIGEPEEFKDVQGGHHHTAVCRRRIWVEPQAHLLAHEIGHAFDLEHVEDVNNIMSSDANDWDVTEDQIDHVQRHADLFRGCADGAPKDAFDPEEGLRLEDLDGHTCELPTQDLRE